MIVKILQKSATFKAVAYNTDKMEKGKGELLEVSGFGALEGLEEIRPQDYANYLSARSATSSNIIYPQFHAVLSCKGREYDKRQLAEMAKKWLVGMGYGNQPYLLIYHNDTENNHVHMVSTRVGPDGRKINDSYERIRAYQVLDQLMGLDHFRHATKDVQWALSYQFSTRAQFMMLLEQKGYALKINSDHIAISKFGRQLTTVPLKDIQNRIGENVKDIDRIAQLRAVIFRYRDSMDKHLVKSTDTNSGRDIFSNGLTSFLGEKFGLHFLFHSTGGRPPYGYTVIDHAHKTVYKGGDLMPMSELADLPEDLGKQMSTSAIPLQDNPIEHNQHSESPATETVTEEFAPFDGFRLDISDDVDDEAILGMKRRKKRKARTNTR